MPKESAASRVPRRAQQNLATKSGKHPYGDLAIHGLGNHRRIIHNVTWNTHIRESSEKKSLETFFFSPFVTHTYTKRYRNIHRNASF